MNPLDYFPPLLRSLLSSSPLRLITPRSSLSASSKNLLYPPKTSLPCSTQHTLIPHSSLPLPFPLHHTPIHHTILYYTIRKGKKRQKKPRLCLPPAPTSHTMVSRHTSIKPQWKIENTLVKRERFLAEPSSVFSPPRRSLRLLWDGGTLY